MSLTRRVLRWTNSSRTICLLWSIWAPWCGPCREPAPSSRTWLKSAAGSAFVKVNTEAERELSARFPISRRSNRYDFQKW
ncbi:thioredoxin domain-containing protein [Shigella flexneri]